MNGYFHTNVIRLLINVTQTYRALHGEAICMLERHQNGGRKERETNRILSLGPIMKAPTLSSPLAQSFGS